jgi:hypothetical protein
VQDENQTKLIAFIQWNSEINVATLWSIRFKAASSFSSTKLFSLLPPPHRSCTILTAAVQELAGSSVTLLESQLMFQIPHYRQNN